MASAEMAVSEDLVMNPRLICAAYREKLHRLFRETAELDGEFGKWQLDVPTQLFAIVAALLSWRDGQGLEIKWTLNWQYVAILSQTILRISESILGLDFNRMSDDADLL